MPTVDDEFTALPLHALADAGLTAAATAGAEHADVRVHRHVFEIRLLGIAAALRVAFVTR